MLRVLRLYWHFFCWQRTMLVVAVIGLLLLAAGVFLPLIPPVSLLLNILGAGFAFFFATIFSPFGFRQLVSNRRFVLVPGFRRCAPLALLLIVVTGTAAVVLVAVLVPRQVGSPTIIRLALLSFACISAYVLSMQWLVTVRFGLFLLAGTPIIAARLFALGHSMLTMNTGVAVMTAAAAGLAWVWLLAASLSASLPRVIRAPGLSGRRDPFADPSRVGFNLGSRSIRLGSPEGTLLRGFSDDWRARLFMDLIFLLSFPIGMLVVFRFMGYATKEEMPDAFSPAFFLVWSVAGVCLMPSMFCGEWPAASRKLWLRMAGDRDSVWRLMERSLLLDAFLSALAACPIALAVLSFGDVSVRAAVLYVTGIALGIPLTTYLSILIRASGWNRLIHVGVLAFLAAFIGGLSLGSLSSHYASSVAGVLSLIALLALGFRAFARRHVRRIDWCAVRPLRIRRAAF